MEKHEYGEKKYLNRIGMYEGPIWEAGQHRRVVLTNLDDCASNITVDSVLKCIRQRTAYRAWEEVLATWFVEDVVKALKNRAEEAEISRIFSCKLVCRDGFGFIQKTQKEVEMLLMGQLFEVISEDSQEMRVRIIPRALLGNKV